MKCMEGTQSDMASGILHDSLFRSTGRKAAECYIKAANAQEHQKEISRQASYLQEAGHVLKRISPDGRP